MINFIGALIFWQIILKSSSMGGTEFFPESDIFFLVRSRSQPFNDDGILTLQTKENIAKTSYNTSKPTTFLIHGFVENRRAQLHLLLSRFV